VSHSFFSAGRAKVFEKPQRLYLTAAKATLLAAAIVTFLPLVFFLGRTASIVAQLKNGVGPSPREAAPIDMVTP
jgi:hypothetical protein